MTKTTIENKRKELIENIDNAILKIQKTKTVFDLDLLKDYKNNYYIKNIYIVFDNKGLNVFSKETFAELDFSYEDIVDFVVIKSIRNCSLQVFCQLNQDEEFVNSVIEALKKYRKKLIGLEKLDEFDCGLYNADYAYELYDYGDIPYSIATNGQRLYKIFRNRSYPEEFWECIWAVSFHASCDNIQLPYIDSDNFRKLLTENAIKSNVYGKGFEKNLDEFLETAEELDLEDGLNDFFYAIVEVVSDWSW